MSHDRQIYQGLEQIQAKFKKFTFSQIQYQFDEYDVQPVPIQGGMLIMIVGTLQIDSEMQVKFSQTFQIVPRPTGDYCIVNDIFRTIY